MQRTESIGKIIFIENEEWKSGLIGLVSGHLREQYNRPAIAFTKNSDGDYVIVAQYYGEIMKFDSAGNIIWNKQVGSSEYSEWLYGLDYTSDGGYVATGMSMRFSGGASQEF